MDISPAYSSFLTKLEGISGAVPGKPGYWTWFFDNVGVVTFGYGHVLHHPDTGGQITRALYGSACADLANRALIKYYGTTDVDTPTVLALKAKDMSNFAADVIPMLRPNTTQAQCDMLVDFAYNAGTAGLKGSTLLRTHNAGNGQLGTTDIATLAARSKAGTMQTIGDDFAAWSHAGGRWDLGVFHRRMFEFLVYSGVDYDAAHQTAWSFNG